MLALAPDASAQQRTLDQRQIEQLKARQLRTAEPLKITGIQHDRAVLLNQDSVPLAAGEFIKTTVQPETRQVDGRTRHVLPIRLTGFDRSSEHVVDLAPYFEVEQDSMCLEPDGITYAANVLVGLDDEQSPGSVRSLARAFDIRVTAFPAEVDTPDISIAETGGRRAVRLSSTAPGDQVKITLRFRREKVDAFVGVKRPHLIVAAPSALDGLGFGDDKATISVSDDAGPVERTVSVGMDGGIVEPTQVTISAGKPAEVTIRSAGLKSARLRATNPSLRPANQTISLAMPSGFFIAALVGGGLGSLCARLTRPNRSRKALIRHFIAGVIAGLIGAALYLLGVDVSGASIKVMNTELSVAVIAALVSIGGVGLLKLSKSVNESLEPDKGA
jgi:hypothetical protein